MKPILFFLLLALSSGATPASQPAPDGPCTLRVLVTGLRSKGGIVKVALCNSEASFQGKQNAIRNVDVRPSERSATVVFRGLAPGLYAVMCYHDENSNGKLDKNVIGLPSESYGFSNDARGIFGLPAFQAAAIKIQAPDTQITIRVH